MSENQRFVVTARKYRPQTFEDLVAQDHVSETLRNAIQSGRLAHAYLFSGPRGVGKTTCARLLAKAINCTTPLKERARGEACRQCDSCQSFEEGRSLNIIEIDAASNNSVEDVRALREKVVIPPQGARKKVYIIDEVHMLSNAAFNALLKTLEEPPPHALFIFATTEPHKVLPTILSRCQRFDFKRIPVADIVARLREICALEGFTADEESLVLIAQKGDGALRDSLSAFDQAIALCGTDLRYDALAKALGVIATELYFKVTDLVLEDDHAGVFNLVHELVQSGADYQEFLNGLARHLRDLLVAHTTQDGSLIEASETVQRRYAEAAQVFREADLLRMLHLVAEGELALKQSAQPRLRLELTLLKMVTQAKSADLTQLLRKLDALEQMVKSGQLPPASGGTSSSGGEKPAPPVGPAAPAPAAPRVSTTALPETPSSAQPVSTPQSVAAPATTSTRATNTAPNLKNLFGTPALQTLKAPKRPAPPDESTTANAAPVPPKTEPQEDYNRIFFLANERWADFMEHIRQISIPVHGALSNAQLALATRDALQIEVPNTYVAENLSGKADFIGQELGQLLSLAKPPKLSFIVKQPSTQETQPEAHPQDPYQQLQRLSQTHPVVRTLMDQFGGEIVW